MRALILGGGVASAVLAATVVWQLRLPASQTVAAPERVAAGAALQEQVTRPPAEDEDTVAVAAAPVSPDPAAPQAATVDVSAAAAMPAQPLAAALPDTAQAPDAVVAAAASVPPPAAAEATGPEAPAFDVVRIEADGAALVAGRAAPGTEVVVLVDDADVATVPADAQGRFVAMFTLAASAQPRVMTLRMRAADGVVLTSADRVLIAPILAATAAPLVAAAPVERDDVAIAEAPLAAPAALAPAPVSTVAPPQATTALESLPPQAILLTDSGARVLQSGSANTGKSAVSIDTISYSAEGQVVLAGRGEADAFVRLYLNNKPLLETGIAADGTWGGTLPVVAAGVYTLRADQISAQGRVTSRYVTPFQREDPAALAVPAGDPARAVAVTVQPGFTLWQIAEERYGEGMLYVQVYEANRAQIGDPDLIYPGQVFAIPEATAVD